MSRIFHRPMFRTGGSSNNGITSGLRSGYKRGRVVEPGGYSGFNIKKAIDESPEAYKSYQEILGDYPKSQARSDFLINFGLDLASRSPSGNIISTAAESAKEPFKIMQQQDAYDKAARREEEKDFLDTFLTTQAQLRGGEAGATYKHSDMAAGAVELQNQINAHNDAWNSDWDNMSKEDLEKNPDYIAWGRKKKNLNLKMDNYSKITGVDLEFVLSKLGDDGVTKLQSEIVNDIKLDESPMIKNGQPVMDPDDPTVQLTVGDYYSDGGPGEAELAWEVLKRLGQRLSELERQNKIEKENVERMWTHAEGGRAGYQQGNLVEQMDVDVMTPKGDMAMQETVEEGVMPDQLSYEELRSRLPVEITDDIVRLLVSSASALGDFAQIQTQQDVDNFNAKYGVNLVLPSEA